MARIILEDMKLNRNRKQFTPKREVVPTAIPAKEIHKSTHIEKEIKEEDHEKISKKEQKREEEKVDEYFKSIKKENQRIHRTPRLKTTPRLIHKTTLGALFLVGILGISYWGGDFFQRANITITSKYEVINYKNKQFTASKNSSSNVNFEIMITSDKKKVNVVLTEPKEVSIKAEGSITLYNEFSTQAQRIGVGTYVSDDDGKTYKTNSTVSIPGYKTVNKKIVPGEIVVKVTSFLPGDAYNGNPENFHINVFKGTTKYNKIYGKLKDPLIGGASGVVYTVDNSNQKNIDNIANTSLKESLFNQVQAMVPEGYILYPGATTFTYNINNNVLSKTPESEVEMEGTLAAILLKEQSLTENIIKVSLPEVKGDELKEIVISDLDELSFGFVNPNQPITKDMNNIAFSLTGNVNAIWKPDTEYLKTKLLGIHENDVLSIFRQDPGISSAIVKIFPPWQNSIPEDVSKINISSN